MTDRAGRGNCRRVPGDILHRGTERSMIVSPPRERQYVFRARRHNMEAKDAFPSARRPISRHRPTIAAVDDLRDRGPARNQVEDPASCHPPLFFPPSAASLLARRRQKGCGSALIVTAPGNLAPMMGKLTATPRSAAAGPHGRQRGRGHGGAASSPDEAEESFPVETSRARDRTGRSPTTRPTSRRSSKPSPASASRRSKGSPRRRPRPGRRPRRLRGPPNASRIAGSNGAPGRTRTGLNRA